jgi:hypothetical protein
MFDTVQRRVAQRSQLQPGVPSLGRCVTLLPATFCNLGLGDLLSSCNKRIVFISYSFLLGKPTARNDLKLLLDYRAPPDDRQVTYVRLFGNVDRDARATPAISKSGEFYSLTSHLRLK